MIQNQMIKAYLNNQPYIKPQFIKKHKLAFISYYDIIHALYSNQQYLLFIIEKANIEQIKIMAPLIMNNFYTNILESETIEEQVLSLIWDLLNKEIPVLNNQKESKKFEENFLNQNSKLYYFLSELINKNDIKNYFTNVLNDVLQVMENYTSINLVFDINSLKKEISIERKINLTVEDIQERKDERNSFYGKYIIAIKQKDLTSNMNDVQESEIMKQYCLKQLNCYEGQDDNLFSTEIFINELFAENESEELIDQYELNFMLIKKFINLLFEKFLFFIDSIPYSIRSICKLIKMCYEQKNKNYTSNLEIEVLINKFFFQILFNKIFLNPDLLGYIHSFKISKSTKEKIKQVIVLINQMTILKFFSNKNNYSEYTTFNWYFLLDIMPNFFKFVENLTKVNFSSYIDTIIKEKKHFPYDFFKENPNDFFYYNVICITSEQMISISEIFLDIIENKEFERKFSKNESEIFIPNLKQRIRINDMKKNPPTSFTLDLNLVPIKKIEGLINLTNSKFYSKEEISHPTEEQIVENNVIKIQNFLCNLLYNYRNLNINDFSKESINGTINILKELIKFFKKGSFISDENIPSEWYANSLITMLTQLPEEYKENDFEKVFKSLDDGITESRQSFDFKPFGVLYNKLKFIHRDVVQITNINEKINNLIKEK